MSTLMMFPGCKPPSQSGWVGSESAEQLSWHPLPIWPLLLVVRIWSTRSSPLHHLLSARTHFWRLLSPRGRRDGTFTSPPGFPESRKQKSWDTPRIEATLAGLLGAADETTQARLLAVSCPEAGAWLNAFPISSVGLRMDNDVVRIAVGLRLGLPLCHPHACSDCGAQINEFGSHGLSCRFSRGRHSRHASLNDIIKRSLATALIWSLLGCTELMASDQMVLLLSLGREEESWCGTLHV